MKKECSTLARLVHRLHKVDSGDSDVSRVNGILEQCSAKGKEQEKRLIKWALKILGPKNKRDLGLLAKHALTQFLCRHREHLTDEQRGKFIERAVELPPDLQFSFGKKKK